MDRGKQIYTLWQIVVCALEYSFVYSLVVLVYTFILILFLFISDFIKIKGNYIMRSE